MKKIIVVVAIVMLFGLVSRVYDGSSGSGSTTTTTSRESSRSQAITACVNRGIAYFKEIGSYPRLTTAPNSGRRAEDVARERCNRTVTAF